MLPQTVRSLPQTHSNLSFSLMPHHALLTTHIHSVTAHRPQSLTNQFTPVPLTPVSSKSLITKHSHTVTAYRPLSHTNQYFSVTLTTALSHSCSINTVTHLQHNVRDFLKPISPYPSQYSLITSSDH